MWTPYALSRVWTRLQVVHNWAVKEHRFTMDRVFGPDSTQVALILALTLPGPKS